MIVYLDESGDLGFNLASQNASRYFVLTSLVCEDNKISQLIDKSIKKTLKNKVGLNINELKRI